MAIEFLDDVKVGAGLEVTGTLKDSSGDVGTSGQVLSSLGSSGTDWVDAAVSTNIGNSDLTLTSSNRNLTYYSAGSTLNFVYGGTTRQSFGLTSASFFSDFYLRSLQGSTGSPVMRFSEAAVNGSNFISLQAAASLTTNTAYTLPTADGTSGQALTTDGAGAMSWATPVTSPTLITAGGGRVYMSTTASGGNRAIVLGGNIGFNYYNWSTEMRASNLVFSGLGNPGTTTENVTPSSGSQGVFEVLKSGTIKVQGTIEGQNFTDVYSGTVYIYVFRLPSSIVLAMGNGGIQSTAAYELVASAGCVMPSTQASTRPQRFASGNGVSVTAGDFVFAAVAFSGTTTATRYFYTNFQMLTS